MEPLHLFYSRVDFISVNRCFTQVRIVCKSKQTQQKKNKGRWGQVTDMPPKRLYGNRDESDDDDSEESESTDDTSDSASSGDAAVPPKKSNATPAGKAPAAAGGRGIANKPHDEEFDVDDGRHLSTPPGGAGRKPQPGGAAASSVATKQATVTPASKSDGSYLRNNPNDETFDVDDDRGVKTPPRGQAAAAVGGKKASGGVAAGGLSKRNHLHNTSHDEFDDVDDDMGTETPRQGAATGGGAAVGGQKPGALNPTSLSTKNLAIRNDHHDEAIEVSPGSSAKGSSTPGSSTKKAMPQAKPTGNTMQSMKAVPRDESSSGSEDEGKSGSGGNVNKRQMSQIAQSSSSATTGSTANKFPEYNPQDYAHLNARASREVQELFTYITGYQPVLQDLPSKLRPFIPDYIPSVGDLDPFCKIPRPDGRPDYLGLHVVDEPCANQSNPAVVKIGLQYQSKVQSPAVFVDCVEDAANRPNVIDKWVADIKKLHYKKPLPTVNYSKPMPDIEALLQVWPQEFEDLLNSDLQFPPTQVDLDIDQYVRVMCAILDIPTYGNLIESLHVMFTLYMEFRANQHFQHA
jgi:intraflagellar transport protein 46